MFKNFVVSLILVLVMTNSALALNFPKPEQLFTKDPVVEQQDPDSEFNGDEVDEERERRIVPIPRGNLITDILPKAVNLFLYFLGLVVFVVLVYAGIRLIVSRGDEDEITKLKDLIIHLLIGAAIVGGAFAIVSGVLRVLVNL